MPNIVSESYADCQEILVKTSNKFLTTISRMSIGDRIRTKREKLGLSQEAVAKYVGVTREAVSQWEKGETEPLGKRLEKLAEILQTSPIELRFGIDARYLPPETLRMLEDWTLLPKDLQRDFAYRINVLANAMPSKSRNVPASGRIIPIKRKRKK